MALIDSLRSAVWTLQCASFLRKFRLVGNEKIEHSSVNLRVQEVLLTIDTLKLPASHGITLTTTTRAVPKEMYDEFCISDEQKT